MPLIFAVGLFVILTHVRYPNTMTETVPSSGGFAVPTEFAAEWLDASLPNEIVRISVRFIRWSAKQSKSQGGTVRI